MSARTLSRRALGAASLLLTCFGCGASLDFNSPSPLGFGVIGKRWNDPYFVDSPLFTPGALSQPNTNGDFAAATNGASLQLVGAWWNPATGATDGYARLYQDGVGWSGLGPNFTQFASTTSNSASIITGVSVAAGPGGMFVANAFAQDIFTHTSASAYNSGSGWQKATNIDFYANVPDLASDTVTVIDAFGRGYVFFSDVLDGPGAGVYETQWGVANPSGITSTINRVSTGVDPGSLVTARFDGVKQVCVTYQQVNALMANCQDTSLGGPYSFAPASAQTLATGVSGHATATDGAGKIMTVFYKGSGTTYHVYASLGSNAVWPSPSSVVQLDSGLSSDGYVAPNWTGTGLSSIAGTRPGVAYVGNGRYVAVWIGVHVSASPAYTQLYSNYYDPANGGWQGPVAIDGTKDSFTALPHPRRLTVFGANNGNAGYALNRIFIDAAIGGTYTSGNNPPAFPETAQVRVTQVNRWQVDQWQNTHKWIGVQEYPKWNCFNQYAAGSAAAATGSGGGTECDRAPVGAILPSGNTLVFFKAQDNYSQVSGGNTIPGNMRVGALEFK